MKKLIALLISISMLVCMSACKDKAPETIIIDDLELDKTFSYEDISVQVSSNWDFGYVKNADGELNGDANFRCPDDKGRISFTYELYDDKEELGAVYNEKCQHFSETADMHTLKVSDIEINVYEWDSDISCQKNYIFTYNSKLYVIIFIISDSEDCSIYTNSDEIIKTMTLN